MRYTQVAATKFTKTVYVPRLTPEGEISKDPDGNTIHDREVGVFTFKRLTIMDDMEVGVLAARRLGGLRPDQVDQGTLGLARMYATLKLAIVEGPDGWTLEGLSGTNGYSEIAAVSDAYNQGLSDATTL